MELSCAICMETFVQTASISITQCGHMFHENCVSSWYDKSATCPHCRKPGFRSNLIRLHLSVTPDEEIKPLERQVEILQEELTKAKREIANQKVEISSLTKENMDVVSQMSELRLGTLTPTKTSKVR